MEAVPIQYRVLIAVVQKWAEQRGIRLGYEELHNEIAHHWFHWSSPEDEVRWDRDLRLMIDRAHQVVWELGYHNIRHQFAAAERCRSNFIMQYPELESVPL